MRNIKSELLQIRSREQQPDYLKEYENSETVQDNLEGGNGGSITPKLPLSDPGQSLLK